MTDTPARSWKVDAIRDQAEAERHKRDTDQPQPPSIALTIALDVLESQVARARAHAEAGRPVDWQALRDAVTAAKRAEGK